MHRVRAVIHPAAMRKDHAVVEVGGEGGHVGDHAGGQRLVAALNRAYRDAGELLNNADSARESTPIAFVDLVTGRVREQVIGLVGIAAAFSPDGRRVVFSRSLSGNNEIFVATTEPHGLIEATVRRGEG